MCLTYINYNQKAHLQGIVMNGKIMLGETTPKNLPKDFWEVTPVEREASARILGSNPYIRVSYTSLKQEAPSFS